MFVKCDGRNLQSWVLHFRTCFRHHTEAGLEREERAEEYKKKGHVAGQGGNTAVANSEKDETRPCEVRVRNTVQEHNRMEWDGVGWGLLYARRGEQ